MRSIVVAALLLIGAAAPAAFAADTPRFLLTFKDATREQGTADCAFIHNVLALAAKRQVPTTCDLSGRAAVPGDAGYHVAYDRQKDGSIAMSIRNLSPARDETEFETLAWKIEPAGDAEQKLNTQRLLEKFVQYVRGQRALKEMYLTKGLRESSQVGLDGKGEYVHKSTGKRLEFQDAYRLYQDESPRQKHYLRAALEILGELGVGFVWYWWNADFNAVDWEMKWDWPSWRAKIITFEAVSFDSNHFNTNAIDHPSAGAFYYGFARSNGLNILESLLAATAGSAMWEYLVEFKEKISLNDMILTPLGGMAIGETMLQLGAFFERGSNNIVNRTLALIFSGGTRDFHNWMDKNRPRRTGNVDGLGFTREMFHEFKIFAGLGTIQARQGSHHETDSIRSIGLETLLVNIPTYGKPGHVSTVLSEGNFSQTILRASFGQEGFHDFLLFLKVALAGYYRQSIERGEKGDLKGYSFFIGPSVAYEYSAHRQAGVTPIEGIHEDRLCVVDILGSTMELTYYRGGLKLKAQLDVFGNMALVRSYALQNFEQSGGTLQDGKLVLQNHRYYYALGMTLMPRVTASYGPFEIGAEARIDHFDSIEGWDRHQDTLKEDLDMVDRRRGYRAWVSYTLPWDHLKLSVSAARYYRQGEIEGAHEQSRDERVYQADLQLLF
jgi:hypothetical protein